MQPLETLLQSLKIIPVVTVGEVEDTINLCRALEAGGIKTAEITLRTPDALDAIKAVRQALPEFVVGAGTVKTPADMEAVAKLGVAYAVSPGLTKSLSDCAEANDLAFLPGVATASEVLMGMEWGRRCFKLFPAEAVGGQPLLKSLAAPFSEVSFCPTGGVNADNYSDYLALPNVIAVGGSWMTPDDLVSQRRWQDISALSRAVMAGT